jgi:DNA-binding MarR family transcriptional regulator
MTPVQHKILMYLYERVDARASEITSDLGISFPTFQRAVPDMYIDELMRHTKLGSKHVCRYMLTHTGTALASRLLKYANTVGQVALPIQINKLAGVYEPSCGYQRNNGHRHLQSAGFAC